MQITVKEIQTKEVDKIAEIICDMCGKILHSDRDISAPDMTEETEKLLGLRFYSNIDSCVTVEIESVAGYGGEGGESVKLEADICGECFMTKLKPFIESFRGPVLRRTYSKW
jgi:hypothetical protein